MSLFALSPPSLSPSLLFRPLFFSFLVYFLCAIFLLASFDLLLIICSDFVLSMWRHFRLPASAPDQLFAVRAASVHSSRDDARRILHRASTTVERLQQEGQACHRRREAYGRAREASRVTLLHLFMGPVLHEKGLNEIVVHSVDDIQKATTTVD